MCAMKHYPHGSEQAGPLAMKELSQFTDCIIQFVKLIIVSGEISYIGEISVTGLILATGLFQDTGVIIEDGAGL